MAEAPVGFTPVTLLRPTVKEVIALLEKMNPDAPFRIEDADTSWTIDTIHVVVNPRGTVWFSGEYSEMTSSNDD